RGLPWRRPGAWRPTGSDRAWHGHPPGVALEPSASGVREQVRTGTFHQAAWPSWPGRLFSCTAAQRENFRIEPEMVEEAVPAVDGVRVGTRNRLSHSRHWKFS